MKEHRILVGLSILLCLIGFFIRDIFLNFSVNVITGENDIFNKSWKLPHHFFPFLLFLFSLGIIPFLYSIVKRICKLNTFKNKCSSIILICTCGITFLLLRIMHLKFKAYKIKDLLQRAEFAEGAEIPEIRFEEMYLEVFLFIGLIIGTFLSILTYRKKYLNANKNGI